MWYGIHDEFPGNDRVDADNLRKGMSGRAYAGYGGVGYRTAVV